jgi:hypothetical protein
MGMETISTSTCLWSLGDDGILRGEIRVGVLETLSEAKANVDAMAQLARGRKLPVLVNVSRARMVSREARQCYAGAETAKLTVAAALIVGSPISRVLGNFFLGLNRPAFPLRLFTSEEDAVAWLKGLPR